jgi:hypothetical protein
MRIVWDISFIAEKRAQKMKSDRHIQKYGLISCVTFAAGLFIVALYYYLLYTNKGILHGEALYDIENFISGGMHGVCDFISKSFNLTMIEAGRIGLGFLPLCSSILT